MNKLILILTLLLALITVPTSYGHGGGLDSNGGHYNRKTGEYHRHRQFDTNHSGGLDKNGGHYNRKTGEYHRHR